MLVVIFWYIARTFMLFTRDEKKKKRKINHQLDNIARVGGYLASDAGGDHLGEPFVEGEVLPGHRPHQVHALLLRHMVDVAEARVVLELSNGQNGLDQNFSTFLEEMACAILARVKVRSKTPAQCSSHRSQWC